MKYPKIDYLVDARARVDILGLWKKLAATKCYYGYISYG